MILPFKQLPDDSRIWIYQSSKAFNAQEETQIKISVEKFLAQWTAHGKELEVGYTITENRFIVLAVNENFNSISGCSIDSSVHFIQQIENEYNIDLIDKMNIVYEKNNNLHYSNILSFKKLAKQKEISPNTIVFNNLVHTIGEFKDFWKVPAKESWHKRFF